ncbi:MAG: hypothetical protein HRT88_23595, partial [Lentisphaeraceae bacterium]|nr:hypothetical protein [Lentisphaeraceae bacterium]
KLGLFVDIASREKSYRFTEHKMDLQVQHNVNESENFISHENAVLLENQAFISALRSGDTSGILSPYNDALETFKVGLAADLSIREKRSVKISEL